MDQQVKALVTRSDNLKTLIVEAETPTSCPLAFICTPWLVHACTHVI